MSITDPDCGICKTVTFPDGSTHQINHLFPKALEHHYPLPPLNATSVPVYRGYWDHVGTAYRGVIVVDLEPTPRLVAHGVREVTFPDGLPSWLGKREPASWVDPDALALPKRKPPAPPKTTVAPRTKAKTNARQTFTHLHPIEIGKRENVHELRFFLLNGWTSHDGLTTCVGGSEHVGRIEVKLGDWQLRIEPRGDVTQTEVRKHMRSTGRSTITHIGRIRDDNGDPFDADDALEVLDAVENLIGFALGRVTAIILPVGYRDGMPVWSQLKCNRAIDRPLGPSPFLDIHHTAAQMAELLRAGYDAVSDTLRWEVFLNALGYHYSAHDSTVNMKVLLPVSALQLLSYAHLVEELKAGDPGRYTPAQWRALATVTQLRDLLKAVGADLTVPPHMTRLIKVQADITDKTLPHPDALDCVVRLRNKVAHPKQKEAKRWSTEEWGETGFAATTMFNVAMLWWLGYDERFAPQTAEYRGAGDSVYVPWH